MEKNQRELDLDFFKKKTQKKQKNVDNNTLLLSFSDVFFIPIFCSLFIMALYMPEKNSSSYNSQLVTTAEMIPPTFIQEDITVPIEIVQDQVQNTSSAESEQRLRQQVIEIFESHNTEKILNQSFEQFASELNTFIAEQNKILTQNEK